MSGTRPRFIWGEALSGLKTISLAPETHVLQQVPWDFWVTLTHRCERSLCSTIYTDGGTEKYRTGRWWEDIPKHKQHVRFKRWKNKLQKTLRIPKESFFWAMRLEKGRGGRDHFHVLVRLGQRRKVNRGSAFCMRALWKDGGAVVKVVNETGLESYIAKVQKDYEESRFCTEPYRSVELSPKLSEYFKGGLYTHMDAAPA